MWILSSLRAAFASLIHSHADDTHSHMCVAVSKNIRKLKAWKRNHNWSGKGKSDNVISNKNVSQYESDGDCDVSLEIASVVRFLDESRDDITHRTSHLQEILTQRQTSQTTSHQLGRIELLQKTSKSSLVHSAKHNRAQCVTYWPSLTSSNVLLLLFIRKFVFCLVLFLINYRRSFDSSEKKQHIHRRANNTESTAHHTLTHTGDRCRLCVRKQFVAFHTNTATVAVSWGLLKVSYREPFKHSFSCSKACLPATSSATICLFNSDGAQQHCSQVEYHSELNWIVLNGVDGSFANISSQNSNGFMNAWMQSGWWELVLWICGLSSAGSPIVFCGFWRVCERVCMCVDRWLCAN